MSDQRPKDRPSLFIEFHFILGGPTGRVNKILILLPKSPDSTGSEERTRISGVHDCVLYAH